MMREESVYMECKANSSDPKPVAAYAHEPSLDADFKRGEDSDLPIYWSSFLAFNIPLTTAAIPSSKPVPFQPLIIKHGI
jgi:hypothetical protein